MLAQGALMGAGFAMGSAIMSSFYGPDGWIPAWIVPLLIGGGFAAYYMLKRRRSPMAAAQSSAFSSF
jgi:hypothetical protein